MTKRLLIGLASGFTIVVLGLSMSMFSSHQYTEEQATLFLGGVILGTLGMAFGQCISDGIISFIENQKERRARTKGDLRIQ